MSSPILVQNPKVIDNASLASSVESGKLSIKDLEGYAVHSVFTGSPSGTFKVMGGCSETTAEFVEINSVSISGASINLLNVEFARYPYINIIYTRSSGTGNLTVYLAGKQ